MAPIECGDGQNPPVEVAGQGRLHRLMVPFGSVEERDDRAGVGDDHA
jgi:hypothetical protein